jgi:hypothetical protein
MEQQENNGFQLYSTKSISIATFIGGPLAASILLRKNYINLGKEKNGKLSLIIGIISTILLLVLMFIIPEDVIDKIPSTIIPAIYTVIIYFIIERLIGKELKSHKESKNNFYSGWKAAGIGAISAVVLLAAVFAYVFLGPQDFYVDKYDQGLIEFQENELIALELYEIPDAAKPQVVVDFIADKGIPAWEKNIEILDELDKIEGLTKEYIVQNRHLREYCELRIELYKLIEKSVREDTDAYDQQIFNLNFKIDQVLNKL